MERLTREPRRQDPYRSQDKPKGNPRCPDCHAISVKGEWLSEERGREIFPRKRKFDELLCPACQQRRDHYAGSVIELHGERWREIEDQVQRTVEDAERIARHRNDQQRILWTRNFRGIQKIYVTLPDLAEHIGIVLKRTFKGDVKTSTSTEEPYLRVVWNSDSKATQGAKHRRNTKSKSWRSRGVKKSRSG